MNRYIVSIILPAIAIITILVFFSGCRKEQVNNGSNSQNRPITNETSVETENAGQFSDSAGIANSALEIKNKYRQSDKPKQLWAKSFLWSKAPEIQVEKWIGPKPDTQGKYVLLEIWATWCGQCGRSIKDLNRIHEKYSDDLVVIGISNEPERKIQNYKGPRIKYYSGIDTQSRTQKELMVEGLPHIIIIEPGGYVVWEGFPYLDRHKLTEKVIKRIIAVK